MSNFAYSAGQNDAKTFVSTDQTLTMATNNDSSQLISDNNPLNEQNFLENAAQMIECNREFTN
jgi:hypothetical protein